MDQNALQLNFFFILYVLDRRASRELQNIISIWLWLENELFLSPFRFSPKILKPKSKYDSLKYNNKKCLSGKWSSLLCKEKSAQMVLLKDLPTASRRELEDPSKIKCPYTQGKWAGGQLLLKRKWQSWTQNQASWLVSYLALSHSCLCSS